MWLADLPLYRAKAGGRNTFCFFNAHIEKATLARHRLEENCPWRYHGKAPDENLLPVDFDARATQGREMPPPETAFVDGAAAADSGKVRRLHDNRHARSLDAPLRYHRDRQRQLALQEPRITSHPPLATRQDRLAPLYGTPGRRSRLRHSRASEGSLLEGGRVGSDLTARGLKAGPEAGDSSQDLMIKALRGRCPTQIGAHQVL
jgi:hypothetical protein